MPRGYVAIVLHGHLPFVRHPEHRDHLEERWLFEAIAECYLPLLSALGRLERDGVPFRLTFSISPPLLAMLRDELLRERFELHMKKLDRLLAKETARHDGDPYFEPVVAFYAARQRELWDTWRACDRDVAGAFAALESRGLIELWTSGATHAFFPALAHHPQLIRAQISLAVDSHQRALGRAPRGIWLPECGYTAGVDAMLTRYGIAYTALETHALLNAEQRPRYGTAAPVLTPHGLACFGRDLEASQHVWSKEAGYPGDVFYREFYRDVGYDAPAEDVTEFVAADGTRQATGLKYYRITHTGLGDKLPYQPGVAARKAWDHALDFVINRHNQLEWLAERMDVAPVVLAPYDAELFGHWWFEGPDFLEAVFRHMANSEYIAPTTLGEYLASSPTHDIAEPEVSSWGAGGYAGVWLDPISGWMLRHVDHAAREIGDIVRVHGRSGGLAQRAAEQAVRELMLLLSSDWAFLMKTGTAPHYARARFEAHLARFRRLELMLREGQVDERWLADLESRDNLFPHVPLDWLEAPP
jgi:1,4-alpha-glucan branching enzyme